MKIFQICDSPMAYYYQRQSNMINKYSSHVSRYYSNNTGWPKDYLDSDYLDLTPASSREEIISLMQNAELIVFHASRAYKSVIPSKDGPVETGRYLKGKKVICLIHGQPETLHIKETNDFIRQHKKNVIFLVATSNQLNLFPDAKLYPIIGLFSGYDPFYMPRQNYLETGNAIRIIRRNGWKTQSIANYLYKQTVSTGFSYLKYFAQRLMRHHVRREDIFKPPSGVFSFTRNNKTIIFDNLLEWEPHKSALRNLANSDILLENDADDYPGGGTSHTISLEGLSLGVPAINFVTEQNALAFAEFIRAAELPPFQYYKDKADFQKRVFDYLNKLIFDRQFLINQKKACRNYFLKYLDVDKTIPLITEFLEKC